MLNFPRINLVLKGLDSHLLDAKLSLAQVQDYVSQCNKAVDLLQSEFQVKIDKVESSDEH